MKNRPSSRNLKVGTIADKVARDPEEWISPDRNARRGNRGADD